VSFRVNGREVDIAAAAHHTLLDLLRDDLRLTGTKECCAEGECGACTILINGSAVCSCLVLAVEADGQEITTIEGLERDGEPDPLQRAFIASGAVQCGFCIPGMIVAAHHLLMTNASPTRAEIQEALAGNLCRCGGYSRIIEAVERAARDRSEGEAEGDARGEARGKR
jgi:carbon-monoxide dehydrogenase small subunit